ncbi:hypothetical protein [Streptomyces melanosporofaciens]|uniref:hypothetical protein n=1 Tax=Streptomyces melanosporofaciens TaxID=67327 RepID=UPI000AD58DCA|nr:hypothetical protein [Streptomyces melanosporofaciens]
MGHISADAGKDVRQDVGHTADSDDPGHTGRRPHLTSGLSVRAKAVLAAAGTVAFAIGLCMLALVLALQHNLRASADLDARNAAAAIKGQLALTHPAPQRALIVAPGAVTIKDVSGRTVTPTMPTEAGSQQTEATPQDSAGSTMLPAEPGKPIQAGQPYSVKVSPSTTAVDNATGLLLRQAAPRPPGWCCSWRGSPGCSWGVRCARSPRCGRSSPRSPSAICIAGCRCPGRGTRSTGWPGP